MAEIGQLNMLDFPISKICIAFVGVIINIITSKIISIETKYLF